MHLTRDYTVGCKGSYLVQSVCHLENYYRYFELLYARNTTVEQYS